MNSEPQDFTYTLSFKIVDVGEDGFSPEDIDNVISNMLNNGLSFNALMREEFEGFGLKLKGCETF